MGPVEVKAQQREVPGNAKEHILKGDEAQQTEEPRNANEEVQKRDEEPKNAKEEPQERDQGIPDETLYLPEFERRSRVLVEIGEQNRFRVCNTELSSNSGGLSYRVAPNMVSSIAHKKEEWDSTVTGTLNEGWLQVCSKDGKP